MVEWFKKSIKSKCKSFLIGNKRDLQKDRTVSPEEAYKFKEEKKLDLFWETSAKTGENARSVLIEAAKVLYKDNLKLKQNYGKNGYIDDDGGDKLERKKSEKEKKCC